MSLTKKISFYVLILLPVFVLAVFSYMQTRKQLIDKLYKERQNIVAVSANVLHEKLDRLNEIGIAISSWPVFQQRFDDGKWHHALEMLQRIPSDYSYISHALITDTSGNLLAGTVPENARTQFGNAISKWLPGVNKKWEPYLSEVYNDPAYPEMLVSALAVPIKDSLKGIKGILLLEVEVKKFLEWSNDIKVGESGFIYVIDQKGQVATTPAYMHSTAILDYANVPAVKKALKGEVNVEVLYNPVEHEKRLTAYEGVPGYGWAVIAEQNTTVITGVNKSLWPILLFFLLVLTMAIMFARLLILGIKRQGQAKEQLELLTQQIDQANDAIYTLNSNHIITSWNHGAQRMYGYSAKEVLGKNYDIILQTNFTADEIRKAQREIESTQHWTGELKRKTKYGKDIYVQSSISSITDTGKVTGFVAVNFDITEQKKLREEINHFANIVEQSSEAILSWNNQREIMSWNKGAENLFGYTKEEVLGKAISAVKLCELSEEDKVYLSIDLEHKGCWQSERLHYRKDTTTFFGAVTANLIKDEMGKASSVVFFVKDITERKRLEDELKKFNEDLEAKVAMRTSEIEASEKKYRRLFENNALPMWIVDADTLQFLDVNNKAVTHYGYSREEFFSMTALDIRPEEDRKTFFEKPCTSEPDPKNMTRQLWNHLKKDGTIIQVQITNIAIDIDNRKARLITVNDVSEQVKAEAKLAASEKRFRALIENNTDVITMMDKSFNIIYRSPAAQRVTGWSQEEIIDKPALQHVHPEDIAYATNAIKEVMANPGKQFNGMFRNMHKNGHYQWMDGILTNRLQDENINAIVFNFHDITERKAAEEKLIESEMRYRTTLDNMLESVQIIGFDWKYIYVNDALTKQSRYSKEEMIGRTVMELYPGIEQTPIFQQCMKCMQERIVIHGENKMLFPNGSIEWFEQSLQPVPEGIFIISVDISERKKAEEKVKEQTAQLKTLSNNLPGVMIFQITGAPGNKRFTYISKGIMPLTGNTPEEIMENPQLLQNRILPEDFEIILKADEEAYRNFSMFNVEVRLQSLKDGLRWLNIIATPRKAANGEIVWDGFHVDITERKNVAEAVKKSEEHYRLLVEQSADGIFLCDIMGNCLAANTSGCKMLGYTAEEIVTKNLTDAVSSDDHYLIAAEIMKIQDGSISSTEWNVIRKDGSIFIGEVLARILPDSRLQIILRDITERKESERRIKRLNEELEDRVTLRTEQLKRSNEEMEAFTYSVSHDLRAPLRGIIGFTSILEEEYSSKLDAEAMRLTAVIKSNTLKMGQLIDDLLKFSRISRHMLDKVIINTDEMIKQVIASSEIKDSSGKVEWIINPLLETNGDLNTIRQVWINLISNAIKYSSSNAVQQIEIGSYRLNKQVVFFVKDNGVGFEQAYSHKLFKVFQRLHNPADFDGTGVGLAIVDKIISKHGGKVWATGEANKGATFYFSLPDDRPFEL